MLSSILFMPEDRPMDRRTFLLSGTVLASALTAAQSDASKLDVQVTYTGSGTVDESHKIYVMLWDTPDFVTGNSAAAPIASQTISSKSDVAHFDGLQKSPVYVSMVYDPSGKWDAASPPPSGSTVGLYSTEPGTPAPIKLEPGKTTKVSATLDDSSKMP
jgi:hypothetical protein